MSQANVSGTTAHNPSPYLRRYRLPVLPGASTAYDDLLSPIDNNAKMAFIAVKNAQLSSVAPSSSFKVASPPSKPLDDYVCSSTWCYQSAQLNHSKSTVVPVRFELGAEIEEMERRNKELLDLGADKCRSASSRQPK